MQALAGSENAFAGIAHAHTDSTPVLFLPGHPGIRFVGTDPTFDSARNYRGVTKWSQTLLAPDQLEAQMRRAFTALRSGRPRPAMLELPADVCRSEYPGEVDWTPRPPLRMGADQGAVEEAADRLLAARTPLIWAGSGALYAGASAELVDVAELLGAPVMTTLQGKSAIPETHPLAAGVGALVATAMVAHYLEASDVLLAVGSSLSVAPFTRVVPDGKAIIHVTNDAVDIDKDYPAAVGALADAKLFLAALAEELRRRTGPNGRTEVRAATEAELAGIKKVWLAEFEPLFADDSKPVNGYRMFRELWRAVDPDTTMITHEAGASRDIQSVFYQSTVPRSYLGWGQSSQLGFSLGLAMGAKIANPDKLVRQRDGRRRGRHDGDGSGDGGAQPHRHAHRDQARLGVFRLRPQHPRLDRAVRRGAADRRLPRAGRGARLPRRAGGGAGGAARRLRPRHRRDPGGPPGGGRRRHGGDPQALAPQMIAARRG